MSKRTTVYLDDGVDALVDALVRASGGDPEVPVLSQSEVLRLLLRDAANRLVEGDLDVHADHLDEVEGDVLADLLPDHRRAKFLRNEVKDESWLLDMKGGFEDRVRGQLAERFKSHYDPEEAAAYAQTYVKEAKIYWQIIEDDPETFEEKVEFVHDRIAQYRERYEASTYDPNERWLSTFEGVEDAEEPEDVARREEERMAAVAEEALERARTMLSDGVSEANVRHRLSNTYNYPEEAVSRVFQELAAEADGNIAPPAQSDD